MKEYNGQGLTPLFYSEISSSYMLYDIFIEQSKVVISQLIKKIFRIEPEDIRVQRERSYPKKGSIDLFIEFMSRNKKYALLFEVKVHDYLSATDGQISTYYNAVLEDEVYEEVYFVYLTQFTADDVFKGIAVPKTIDEAKKGKRLIHNRFEHISWKYMHEFLQEHFDLLTEEQRLIITLNKQWIMHQCKSDLENNKIDTGERGIADYFSDVTIDFKANLPFGTEVSKNRRQIFQVDATILEEHQLEMVLLLIQTLSKSNAVNNLKLYKTEELTIQAAKDYLSQLAQSTGEWRLLIFYTKLFKYAHDTAYLKLNGTGGIGFSIKLEIKGKGEISLCTIYRNKTIEFSLKR
jgi:hypothetical protein